MFDTITHKAQHAKAVVGATVATAKVLRRESKETRYLVATCFPELTKRQQRDTARRLLAFKVNMGLVHS